MKCIILALLFGTLAVPAAAFSLPQLAPSPNTPATDLPHVATFEGGQRYQAGDYPVIVLTGSYREMGRQYGGLMKTELNEEYTFLMDTFTTWGYTREEMRDAGRVVTANYPRRLKEIFTGMSETSGLSPDDIAVIYYGPILLLTLAPPTSPATSQANSQASCSYLATWGNYTTDGSMVVSRDWDLADVVLPLTKWYVLAVYRPTDGSNAIATWSPAGARPETFMNDKGLFIANDNAGFVEAAPETRPEFITEYYRFMFDYSDLGALDAAIRGTAPDYAWIVDVAGPDKAYVYEKSTSRTLVRTGDGIVAASNHFIDPSWNLSAPPEHSLLRYNNLLRQAEEEKGAIDAEKTMEIRDVSIENGGSKFCHTDLVVKVYSTNHQVVYLPEARTLWMNVMDKPWQKVELAPLFGN